MAKERPTSKAEDLRSKYADAIQALADSTRGQAADEDRDIDFVYRHLVVGLAPGIFPSVSAWEWYLFWLENPAEFMSACIKRADAKAKLAGTITDKRMMDDKREKFSVIERMQVMLKDTAKSAVKELHSRWPDSLKAALLELGWRHLPDTSDWQKLKKAYARLRMWSSALNERERELQRLYPGWVGTAQPAQGESLGALAELNHDPPLDSKSKWLQPYCVDDLFPGCKSWKSSVYDLVRKSGVPFHYSAETGRLAVSSDLYPEVLTYRNLNVGPRKNWEGEYFLFRGLRVFEEPNLPKRHVQILPNKEFL